MNVLMLLIPKKDVAYIYENSTIRQGLTKMRLRGYTAIPVLREDGQYVGSVSEGDFLWYQMDRGFYGENDGKRHYVREILRRDFNPAVRIDVSMDELLKRVMRQNFVCVTDDLGSFIGIVTRQDVIRYFVEILPNEHIKKDEPRVAAKP